AGDRSARGAGRVRRARTVARGREGVTGEGAVRAAGARPAWGVRAGRVRADEPEAPLRGQAARRSTRHRSCRLAVLPRRHGLLLVRLVFVTQQVDPGHPALAATVPMLSALAERADEVVVLADRALPGVLPGNCRVRPFAAGSRGVRGLRFEAALAAELGRRPKPAALIAHMCPIYAVLAAPLARPLGVRVLLWYTHWSVSRTLRAAERLSNVVLTVDRRTFPIGSSKVRAIGHGIDLSEFSCADGDATHSDLRALALGRYSRAKGLEVVLRAVRLALDGGLDVRLEVHGPALNPEERAHRGDLGRLGQELDLGRRARLGPARLGG